MKLVDFGHLALMDHTILVLLSYYQHSLFVCICSFLPVCVPVCLSVSVESHLRLIENISMPYLFSGWLESPKCWNTNVHLMYHIRINTVEKSYQYSSQCAKAFSHNGDLKTHTKSQIMERTFQCSQYDKGLVIGNNCTKVWIYAYTPFN